VTDCEKTLSQSGVDNANAIYDTVGGPGAWYGVQYLIAQLYDRTLQEIGPDLAHQALDLFLSSVDQIHDLAVENAENNTAETSIARFS
jgi:hypothetical protein